jgi:hypothetical protein
MHNRFQLGAGAEMKTERMGFLFKENAFVRIGKTLKGTLDIAEPFGDGEHFRRVARTPLRPMHTSGGQMQRRKHGIDLTDRPAGNDGERAFQRAVEAGNLALHLLFDPRQFRPGRNFRQCPVEIEKKAVAFAQQRRLHVSLAPLGS